MALAFKKGAKVRQVVPVIEGEVVGQQIIDDEVQYEVAYGGSDGEQHSRFFKESELEALADVATEAAEA